MFAVAVMHHREYRGNATTREQSALSVPPTADPLLDTAENRGVARRHPGGLIRRT